MEITSKVEKVLKPKAEQLRLGQMGQPTDVQSLPDEKAYEQLQSLLEEMKLKVVAEEFTKSLKGMTNNERVYLTSTLGESPSGTSAWLRCMPEGPVGSLRYLC